MPNIKNCITYFSMNFLCCSPSAQLKKSSTSRAVGTSVAEEFCSCILSSVVLDAFVEELGVRMLSGFLIKLQGVDSLLLPGKIKGKTKTLLELGSKQSLQNNSHVLTSHWMDASLRNKSQYSKSTHSIHQKGTKRRAE